MFVDASVIVAILAEEPDAKRFEARINRAKKLFVSPTAISQAAQGLMRAADIKLEDAQTAIDRFIAETQAEIVSVDGTIGAHALLAFSRFGKGRNPAKLNMGDCFAYACAKELSMPLLFKGDDFAKTDIEVA
jgi:ribonuclease VapC